MNTPQQQVIPPRQPRNIMSRMTQDLGFAQPRHISIKGGRFSLVDDAGNILNCNLVDQQVGYYIDVVVADSNPARSKVYYEGDYDPTQDTPPVCFSDNGLAPSTNAMQPQSPTCAVCPHNEIGSKISNFSGASIKACSDRKKLAVYIVHNGAPINDLLYQLTIPPASLTNLRGYGAQVTNNRLDVSQVVTRVYFEPGKTGILNFFCTSEISDLLDQMVIACETQQLGVSICGRDDTPRQGGLQQIAPPQQYAALPAPPQHPGYQQPALPPSVTLDPRTGQPWAPGATLPNAAPQPPQTFQQPGAPVTQPPAPRSGRGGPRAGAGRKPPAAPQQPVGGPAPFAATGSQMTQQPTQQFQQPAQQFQQPVKQQAPQQSYPPPQGNDGIPPFLDRTAPAQQGGGAFGVPQQFGAPAPTPGTAQQGSFGMIPNAPAPDANTVQMLHAAFAPLPK